MEDSTFSVSELFDSYEEDFSTNFEIAKKSLDGYNNLTLEEKEEKFANAQRYCSDAQRCLRQMEIEITSLPPSFKGALAQRVKTSKSRYDLLNKQIAKTKEMLDLELQRNNLFSSKSKPSAKREGVRDRLLNTGDSVMDSGAQLDEINQIAHETHSTALTIHGTLRRDREVLGKTTSKSRDIGRELGLSSTIISSIQRRELTDKCILYAIVLVLFMLDCCVFYIKFLL